MVALLPPEETKPKIPLVGTTTNVTPDQAEQRAEKYSFALGESSPGFDSIYQSIVAGRETHLKEHTATVAAQRNERIRSDIMNEVLLTKEGQPLTELEYNLIMGLSQDQLENPETILWEEYARKTASTLYGTSEDGVLQRAADQAPESANALLDAFEEITWKREATKGLIEDVGREMSDHKFRTGVDFAETLLPFLWQYQQHDSVETPYDTSYWTGKNKRQQYAYLMSLPKDEFLPTLRAGLDDLRSRNLLLANDFLQGFLSYSSGSEFLDTAFNVLDLTIIAAPAARALGRVAKTVRNANRSVESIEKEVTALESRATDLREGAVSARQRAEEAYQAGEDTLAQQAWDEAMGMETEISELSAKIDTLIKDTPLDDLKESLKKTVTAMNPAKPVDIAEIAGAAGKDSEASLAHIVDSVQTSLGRLDPTDQVRTLLRDVPTILNPSSWFDSGFALTREKASRIIRELELGSNVLLRTLTETPSISRLPPEAVAQAFSVAEDAARAAFDRSGLNDAILDMRQIASEDNILNLNIIDTRLGTTTGEKFDSAGQAEYYIDHYGLKGKGVVEADSGGYVISVKQPVREDGSTLRDFLINTDNKTPQTPLNSLLQELVKIRTPQELLSAEQRGLREKYIQGISELQKNVKLAVEQVQKLPRKSKRDLSRFLDMLRRDIVKDPKTGEPIPGRWVDSQGEFENDWFKMFNRQPTEKESRAFFEYRRAYDYMWVMQNLGMYTQKASMGIRRYQPFGGITKFGKTGVPEKDLTWVEARRVDSLPWDESGMNVLVVDADRNTVKKYDFGLYRGKPTQKKIDELLDNGYVVLEVFDPFSLEREANFIVTNRLKDADLDFNQIPYRGGGSHDYDYNDFVKQARVAKRPNGQLWHYGDNAIIPATTTAQALDYAKGLDDAARAFKAGDIAGVRQIVMKNLPGVNADSLIASFKNKTLDPDIPFVAVRSGDSTINTPALQKYATNLGVDRVHSWMDHPRNLAKGMSYDHTGKRGAGIEAVREERGTESFPHFQMDKPRLIDPLPTLSRSMGRVLKNTYFRDLQTRTAQHFVEEFHPVLEKGTLQLEELRRNPVAVLHNPVWAAPNNENRALLAAAKGYQNAAAHLGNTPGSQTRLAIGWAESKLLDSVYRRFGLEATDWVYENVPAAIKDPVTFARQVAFHSKLGLFNPVQFFLQGQTAVHAVAILGGEHGWKGVSGGALIQLLEVAGRAHTLESVALGIDPIIKSFAKKATAFGWKEDEFIEMYKQARASGVFNVGPQHAWRSDSLDPDVFQSTAGRFLDKGLLFFNSGERWNHLVGYAGAYSEWRKANPFRKFDSRAQEEVLRRYSTLTMDMTHASNSALNRGYGAVAGQFFSYQTRLLEQLWGKRLTWQEKTRVGLAYAAMYGVPVVGGAWTIGLQEALPFYDDIRAYALQHNIKHENIFIESIMEGVPAAFFGWLTGQNYPIGDRYGPGGMSQLAEIIRGDLSLPEFFMGASGNILGDILSSTWPAMQSMADLVTGRGSLESTAADLNDLAKNISTWSNTEKAYTMLNLGKYIGRKGEYISEATPLDAVMKAVFGLTPGAVYDTRLMERSLAGRSEAIRKARDQAVIHFRRGFDAVDERTAEYEWRRAKDVMAGAGMFPDEQAAVMHEVLRNGLPEASDAFRRFIRRYPIDRE